MKVALVQHDIVWEDAAATIARVAPLVDHAVANGAAAVVLPEMFAVGFSMNAAAVAEPPDGPTTDWLVETARRHRILLVAGVPISIEAGGARAFENHAVAIGPDGSVLARYAKIHPFRFAGEHEHYRAGADPVVFDHGGIRFGLAVCYDLRFPELYRRLMHLGAECSITIANWPSARAAHWDLLLRARALENVSYAIGVNRTGHGGGLDYPGAAALIQPTGDPSVRGDQQEAVLLVDINGDEVREARKRLPFLHDARSDLFPGVFG